jgi:hypothetical protein
VVSVETSISTGTPSAGALILAPKTVLQEKIALLIDPHDLHGVLDGSARRERRHFDFVEARLDQPALVLLSFDFERILTGQLHAANGFVDVGQLLQQARIGAPPRRANWKPRA